MLMSHDWKALDLRSTCVLKRWQNVTTLNIQHITTVPLSLYTLAYRFVLSPCQLGDDGRHVTSSLAHEVDA